MKKLFDSIENSQVRHHVANPKILSYDECDSHNETDSDEKTAGKSLKSSVSLYSEQGGVSSRGILVEFFEDFEILANETFGFNRRIE